MMHFDAVVLPVAYVSAILSGYMLNALMHRKTVRMLEDRLDAVEDALVHKELRLQHTVNALKKIVTQLETLSDDADSETDDDMPGLVSA